MSTAADTDLPAEVAPGQVIGGKWRIVSLLGRGGMGAVYEAQNVSIGKRVALKFIDAEFARQPEIASRFQREAEAAGLVESAHIVQVFDSGTMEDGTPYIVMELLRGEDLRGRLRRLGRIPREEAVHVLAQTLRGLHRAHAAGIVHRDLKPENIFLVDRDDDPLFAKIVDFGISKMARREGDTGTSTLTRQGVVLGTPFYMSPEQAQAFADLDHRTDLWSVGAILYECLAGRPPHQGNAYEQIIVSICTQDPPDLREFDPGIPDTLAAFVRRALERDRRKRFQSAKEMLDALQTTGLLSPSLHGLPSEPGAGSGSRDRAPSAPEAPGGRTRVSWTTAQTEVADTSPTGIQRKRATGVRRRGLVLLGGAVAIAAFVLTLGILRRRGAAGTASVTPSAAATETRDTHPPERGASATVVPVDPEPAGSTLPPGSAAAHAGPALVPRGGKKSPIASGTGTLVATGGAPSPNPTPPPASTSKPASGVAGGLQIKTSYP